MENKLEYNSNVFELQRYPITTDKSLRAWSNAELLALDYIKDFDFEKIHLYNDRFGVWNCALSEKKITTVWTYASQQKAIHQNLQLNDLCVKVAYKTPLDKLSDVELVLVKIPKSLELFELFLQQIHSGATENTHVVCSFMTKYFSTSFLKIAEKYFEVIEQSKAWKKARLLILKKPIKNVIAKELVNTIPWEGNELKQYYGVFASKNIDIGTQFLLEHLILLPNEGKVLDLASGNGIIGYDILQKKQNITLTLIDDFNLAIASSKLNIANTSVNFVCNNDLSSFENESFDLIVSNPPFHFEYENNIEVSLSLFREVERCLKNEGRFLMVANSHLNYKTHLIKIFEKVQVLHSNIKFEIIECY